MSEVATTRTSPRSPHRGVGGKNAASSGPRHRLSARAALLAATALGAVTRTSGFAVLRGGGRAPRQPDMPSITELLDDDSSDAPSSKARLTVVQITDVYTLENFPHIKTMLEEKRAKCAPGSKVISVLTGDFLAPYLLSSVDKGDGMMMALAKTPIDYLTWGNHEADIDHRTVCRHVRNFPGTWLNSNMRDHEAMDYQKDCDVVEVMSEDGTNVRRVGLVAVLSDDPALYSHFKPPGAFGGAKLDDPWETLRIYKQRLEDPNGEERCDVVLPLQHLYVPDDHRTCREFDFPVVLSGHDHHRVDEVVEGTRLLKPGLDAVYATVLDLTWDDKDAPSRPKVRATFVKCDQWAADPELARACDRAYDALAPLRNTELALVPSTFEPLSSVDARGRVCTMGKFICSLLRSSLNTFRRQRQHRVDAVLIMGGNIRGGTDYPEGSFFSLEALEAEIKSDEVLGIVPMPGWLLAEGIAATHEGDPIPGWMQYDDGVIEQYLEEDGEGKEGSGKPTITHVAWTELEPDRIYRVATKIPDLTNGQSPPWTDYYSAHPELLPPKGAYINIHAELMAYFARNVWRKIWEAVAPEKRLCDDQDEDGEYDDDDDEEYDDAEPCNIAGVGCDPEGRFEALDVDNTGVLTVDDIHAALSEVLGLSVDDEEKSLAKFVHSFADTTGDGKVTLEDFERFCADMPRDTESNKWRLTYPRQGSGSMRLARGARSKVVASSL